MKQSRRAAVHPPMPVLLLDNRDSFTWNLAQAFLELEVEVTVVDAGEVSAAAVKDLRPRLVCIGPGPRGPGDLPHLLALTRSLTGAVPLLGVCLGLQALVLAHGGRVGRARVPLHGRRDAIAHDGSGLFQTLPTPLWVMRYHSLVALEVPARFEVTARDGDGQVMAIADASAGVHAVQFHPESIGTAGGLVLLQNALTMAGVVGGQSKARAGRVGAIPPPKSLGPGFDVPREEPRQSISFMGGGRESS